MNFVFLLFWTRAILNLKKKYQFDFLLFYSDTIFRIEARGIILQSDTFL